MSTLPRKRGPKQKGVAASETAILLPVFVLMVFGSIECANAIYLKQSLTLAAYEAASVLEQRTGTMEQAEERCSQILTAREVESHELSVSPLPANVDQGEIFTVEVTSPASAYSVGPTFFFNNTTLSAEVSTVRQ